MRALPVPPPRGGERRERTGPDQEVETTGGGPGAREPPPERRSDAAAGHPVGGEVEVLLHRVEVLRVGLRAELRGVEVVLDVEDGLAGGDVLVIAVAARLRGRALLVRPALLVQRPVEV